MIKKSIFNYLQNIRIALNEAEDRIKEGRSHSEFLSLKCCAEKIMEEICNPPYLATEHDNFQIKFHECIIRDNRTGIMIAVHLDSQNLKQNLEKSCEYLRERYRKSNSCYENPDIIGQLKNIKDQFMVSLRYNNQNTLMAREAEDRALIALDLLIESLSKASSND